MKIDLSCPVELWHFRLPTQQYPVVSMNLFNLSEKTVVSIQAAFLCFDQEGEQFSRQVERVSNLQGEARSAFEVLVASEDGAGASRMDFIIEKVWFEDGTLWRRGAGEMSQYQPNRLSPSRQLDLLKHMAGEDALGYPSDQGAVWVCLCGRPNAASASSCLRCGREKKGQFTQFNQAAVETVIFRQDSEMEEKAHLARVEAGRMQEEREHQELRRKKRIKRSLIAVFLLAFIAAGSYFTITFGIPKLHHYQATQSLEKGEYDKAREAFLALGDFQDAPRMALLSDYQKADSLFRVGTATALKNAEDIYLALGSFQDSSQRRQQASYLRAQLLAQAGDFEQAIPLFEALGSFEDSAAQALKSRYAWAKHRMDSLDYQGARALFLALGSYQDAAQQAEDCLYLPAISHLENQEFEAAEQLLLQLPLRQDAQLKLQETYYAWGDHLFKQQQYEQAATRFLAAGDYLDAFRKASECLYEPAVLAMQAGEYQKARDSFLRILAYRDSAALAEESAYQLGLLAVDAGDLLGARDLLLQAPGHAAAQDSLQQVAYQLAAQAVGEGRLLDAADLYLEAGEYEDAPLLAQKARFDAGIVLMNQKDYAGAEALFAQIQSYPGALEEQASAKYNLAIALLDAGQYQQAEAAFLALGSYSQSQDYLNKARYYLAIEQLEAGEHEAAATAFLALGEYMDARGHYEQARHAQATSALNEGDLDGAIALLADIQGYQNAAELYQSAVYTKAGQAEQAGDLGEAARLFGLIPSYQDAAERQEATRVAYYQSAYTLAKEGIQKRDYQQAVKALEGLDLQHAGGQYADIEQIFKDAAYRYADQLYDQQKPYEALVYYRMIPDYRDVSTSKLKRTPYRIIGNWVSSKGAEIIFRDDGTCRIDGKEMYYFAKNYLLTMGDRPEELNQRYNIVNLRENTLNFTHIQSKFQYRCTRVEQP